MGIGFQALKDVLADLFKDVQFRFVAAYYMQHQNASGPVSEFKPMLAELYGLPMYDSPDCLEKKEAFWKAFNSVEARGLRCRMDNARDEWERLDPSGTQTEKQYAISENIERMKDKLRALMGEEY